MNKIWKKHPRYFWATIGLIIIVLSAYAILRTRDVSTPPGTTVNNGTTVLDMKVYTNQQELLAKPTGIPTGTTYDNSPGLGIHWTQESVVDGNDTCFIFDKNSYQIYASTYTTGGLNPTNTVDSGSTYYTNNIISKDSALKLLQDSCYH